MSARAVSVKRPPVVSKRDLQREWREPAIERFVEAVQAQPAPPCDEFKCARKHTCAVNGWACLAFAEYASGRNGVVRKPDFSKPDERPNAEIFYDRLGMRLLPKPREKTVKLKTDEEATIWHKK